MSSQPSIYVAASLRATLAIPDDVRKKKDKASQLDCFSILFIYLTEALVIRQKTVCAQSSILSDNAAAQDALNKANASIHFEVVAPGADNSEINRVQQINNDRSAERSDIQNDLVTCRQSGQIMMTNASTTINVLEQEASQGSGWLKTLNSLFEVVNSMNRPQ